MSVLELKIPPPVVGLLTAALMYGASRALPEAAIAIPLRVVWAVMLAAAGLATLPACGGSAKPPLPPGELSGAAMDLGHLLREPNFPSPSETRRLPVAIIGAGIGGLSAGWKLAKSGFYDFLMVELESEAGGNSRAGRNEVIAYSLSAHYLPLPTREATAVRELLSELGVLHGDPQAERTAARREQQQVGKAQACIGQPRRQRMTFQVIDRDQRLFARHRQRLCGNEADHDPADQARTGSGGNGIDISQPHAGIGQRFRDQGSQPLDMRARRDLGNDPAIGPVRIVLRGDPLGKDRPVGAHQRGRGFVAGRFNAENNPHPGFHLKRLKTSTSRA